VDTQQMSIGELADAAGLTRRVIRFYVQQKLIPSPNGLGRGKHYDAAHLAQLRRVLELQKGGHSLEEIRKLLKSGGGLNPVLAKAPSVAVASGRAQQAGRLNEGRLRAELWRRLKVLEGVELSFDAGKFNPTVEELLELREAIVKVFRPGLLE